jgi:hypothetical protein
MVYFVNNILGEIVGADENNFNIEYPPVYYQRIGKPPGSKKE